MKATLDWLKVNKALTTLILTVLAGLSSGYVKVQTGPSDAQPHVIIVVPGEDEVPNVSRGPVADRVGLARLRVAAATELAKEQKVSWVKAFVAVSKVKHDDIVACAINAGCPVQDLGDGQFLKNIIDWLLDPANQEKLMKFIQFIMQLAIMFL